MTEVAEAAGEYLCRRGVGDRAAALGGSFFESLPAGYDVHILKWILRNWNDESCRKLLRTCCAALPEHGCVSDTSGSTSSSSTRGRAGNYATFRTAGSWQAGSPESAASRVGTGADAEGVSVVALSACSITSAATSSPRALAITSLKYRARSP